MTKLKEKILKIKTDMQQNPKLRQNLYALLEKHQYPAGARREVIMSFDAQEAMDRDSQGNAWHHWQ